MLKDRNYMIIYEDKFKKGKNNEIQTIIHGDANFNNMMFKYGNDGITPVN